MNITIENGTLRIDVYALLEMMTAAEKLKLADTMACMGDVITYVAQQILDGWTEQGSHGSIGCSPESEPGSGLDWAIREISKRSGFIAAKEILRLQGALKKERDDHQKLLSDTAYLRRHLSSFSSLE